MGRVEYLRCISCNRHYPLGEVEYTCPSCGPRMGMLDVQYDYDRLRRSSLLKQIASQKSFSDYAEKSIWRYLPLLPFEKRIPTRLLQVGGTPLYRFPHLARRLGVDELYIKDEGGNPTGSYKDRATPLAIYRAQELGKSALVCASTGNAAASLAGLAAMTEFDTYIFVPNNAPTAKLAQLRIYGATIFQVDATYDIAYDLALEAADQFGWFNRSDGIHPFLVEGNKTGALEIAEQLAFDLPDCIFVAVGDGSIIAGICKGFAELKSLGLIDSTPQVIGVQAQGADAVKRVFDKYDGRKVVPDDVTATTIADSIAVGKPRDVVKAVKYVWENGGSYVSVSDAEIREAISDIATATGIFTEPAGATAWAGLCKMQRNGDLDQAVRVAVILTGNGLKDPEAAGEGSVHQILPSLDEIIAKIDGRSLLK